MEYLLGLLTGVVFFVLFSIAFYLGYKLREKKPNSKPLDEIEKQRQRRLREDFNKLMAYDVDMAYGRKKVR